MRLLTGSVAAILVVVLAVFFDGAPPWKWRPLPPPLPPLIKGLKETSFARNVFDEGTWIRLVDETTGAAKLHRNVWPISSGSLEVLNESRNSLKEGKGHVRITFPPSISVTYDGHISNDSISVFGHLLAERQDAGFRAEFRGEFHNFLRHGHGNYTDSRGYSYDGSFRDDKREGWGLELNRPKGTIDPIRHEGCFRSDAWNGPGTTSLVLKPNELSVNMTGTFDNGQLSSGVISLLECANKMKCGLLSVESFAGMNLAVFNLRNGTTISAFKDAETDTYNGFSVESRPFVGTVTKAGRWQFDLASFSLAEVDGPLQAPTEVAAQKEKLARAAKWARGERDRAVALLEKCRWKEGRDAGFCSSACGVW